MSVFTEQSGPLPDSIRAASIGNRLHGSTGDGVETAKLLWLAILRHTPWDGSPRPTWANNETLLGETGLGHVSDVKRGLAALRAAGMLETPFGARNGAARKFGRILRPAIDAAVRVLIPDRDFMRNLWLTCAELPDGRIDPHKRPVATVTLVVGLYVIACSCTGFHLDPEEWADVPVRLETVRRFVGARKGHAFYDRVATIERLGLFERCGRRLRLAPLERWIQGKRVLARFAEPAHVRPAHVRPAHIHPAEIPY